MAIYKFDTGELISFIAAFICLLIIAYNYFFKQKKGNASLSLDKYSVRLMLIIFLFIFLNRFFTNIEAVAYKELFNLLEHLSSLAAGLTAIIFSWKGAWWSKSATK